MPNGTKVQKVSVGASGAFWFIGEVRDGRVYFKRTTGTDIDCQLSDNWEVCEREDLQPGQVIRAW